MTNKKTDSPQNLYILISCLLNKIFFFWTKVFGRLQSLNLELLNSQRGDCGLEFQFTDIGCTNVNF